VIPDECLLVGERIGAKLISIICKPFKDTLAQLGLFKMGFVSLGLPRDETVKYMSAMEYSHGIPIV